MFTTRGHEWLRGDFLRSFFFFLGFPRDKRVLKYLYNILLQQFCLGDSYTEYYILQQLVTPDNKIQLPIPRHVRLFMLEMIKIKRLFKHYPTYCSYTRYCYIRKPQTMLLLTQVYDRCGKRHPLAL